MEKNTKKDFKATKTESLTVDDKITIKELEEKIVSMKADKDKKCKAAKEQLLDMLRVTVDKYRTATGTAEALRVLRFVAGDDAVNVTWANHLAWALAKETEIMHKKAEGLANDKMDKLCDGFYEEELFLESNKGKDIFDTPEYKLAFEMMRIDLCRNVGGATEDMVEFIKRVDDEISATEKKLKELKAKEA